MSRRQMLAFDSVLCFGVAGLCYRLYRSASRDAAAIDSAFEVTSESLQLLPKQIESSTKKRILVKVSGFLVAKDPIIPPEVPNEEAIVVRRKSLLFANMSRLWESNSIRSSADEVEVKVKERTPTKEYTKGPEVFLSQNLLETVDMTVASVKPTIISTGWFSKFIGLGLIQIPWKTIDTVEIVRQNKPITVILDAVTDSNGRITLIESDSISDRRIVTSKHLSQVTDAKRDAAQVWKGFSITSGFVGAALAALCFVNRSP